MKKVLITGVNSYVGNSLETWLNQYPNEFEVDKISVRDNWQDKDFEKYDSIVHVAGIAHVSRDPKMEELYYKVNCDLTIQLANKAKQEKVSQFIFLSSIIVYGESIESDGIITEKTIPQPSNFYGNSKLQAEKGILPLQNKHFNVVIIRPPMIYGKGSKGNYPKLSKLAKITPIFPAIENRRSMLHIENLCEFLKLMIVNKEKGLFFPQNNKYVQTSNLVEVIGVIHGKKIFPIKLFNPILNKLRKKQGIINKIFGDLIYDYSLSEYKNNYNVNDFIQTIEKTER